MQPTRTLLLTVAAAVALSTAPGRAADPPPRPQWSWPARAKNLKVLPKNTSADRLRAIMTGYTRALGVRCSHCHVGEEGRPLSTYDFPSDRNPHKDVARGMMKLVREINEEVAEIRSDERKARAAGAGHQHADGHEHGGAAEAGRERAGAGPIVEVECFTCHRGLAVPSTLPKRLTRIYAEAGADSALEEYRRLRRTGLESGMYDFREGSLDEVGAYALEHGDREGAIKIYEQNMQQFPESGRVYESLARAWLAKGDTARAVTEYERALKVEPRNDRAREALERLRRR